MARGHRRGQGVAGENTGSIPVSIGEVSLPSCLAAAAAAPAPPVGFTSVPPTRFCAMAGCWRCCCPATADNCRGCTFAGMGDTPGLVGCASSWCAIVGIAVQVCVVIAALHPPVETKSSPVSAAAAAAPVAVGAVPAASRGGVRVQPPSPLPVWPLLLF